MLLESLDAADVTSVSRAGGNLVVVTSPASLSDVIQSGNIDVNGPPDLSGAFGSEVGSGASTAAQTQSVTNGRQAPLGGAVLDSVLGSGYTYTGSSTNLNYEITLTGGSDGIHADGSFCYSSSGGGSATGACVGDLTLRGSIDGSLTYQTEAARIAISSGQPPKGSLSLSGLTAQLKVNYVATRATGSQIGGKLKPFKIPFAFEMPVCPAPTFCAGVPLYMKVELSILVTLGISARNSTMQGGFTMVLAGAGSVVDQSGFKVIAGSANGFHLSGMFLPGTSITPGASGAEVGLQLKVALGLGIRNLNALLYIAFVAAIGQVTGSAVAGEYCQNYYASFSVSGGIELQLWLFKVPVAAITLFKSKPLTDKQPGCG